MIKLLLASQQLLHSSRASEGTLYAVISYNIDSKLQDLDALKVSPILQAFSAPVTQEQSRYQLLETTLTLPSVTESLVYLARQPLQAVQRQQ